MRGLSPYFEFSAIPYSLDPSGDFVFPNVLEGRYSVESDIEWRHC